MIFEFDRDSFRREIRIRVQGRSMYTGHRFYAEGAISEMVFEPPYEQGDAIQIIKDQVRHAAYKVCDRLVGEFLVEASKVPSTSVGGIASFGLNAKYALVPVFAAEPPTHADLTQWGKMNVIEPNPSPAEKNAISAIGTYGSAKIARMDRIARLRGLEMMFMYIVKAWAQRAELARKRLAGSLYVITDAVRRDRYLASMRCLSVMLTPFTNDTNLRFAQLELT